MANVVDERTNNKYKIVNKMNNDLKAMKGGFIGTLLAGLAGSILPSLLSGKGLKRNGGGLRRAGKVRLTS